MPEDIYRKISLHHPIIDFRSSTNGLPFCMIKTESEDIYMNKRLSHKIRRSFVIKSSYEELGEVLAELLKTLDIDELHIMTYKDRIDVFATKSMKPLYVELYEKLFSLTDDDIDRVEEYKKRIHSCTKDE